MKGNLKNKTGITLIALVVTIVVLLILAGVSISMLTGDNGIITQAQNAKNDNKIAEEKEQIVLAYTAVKLEENYGTVEAADLKTELENAGNTGADVTGSGTLTVTMPSGNVYTIDENGNIKHTEESEGGDSSTDLSGVEVYAKLYSYDDGSGCLLELSSNADTVSSETGVTLKQDYGNIGATAYKYEYVQDIYRENGIEIMNISDKNSIVPQWLELQEMKEEGEGYKYSAEKYMDTNNIIKVKIVDKIKPKNTAAWFNGCMSLQEIEGIENLDTSEVTDMGGMFGYCSGLKSLDVSKFNTQNVTDMKNMFSGCSELTALDVSAFNTENVIDMSYMFELCSKLTNLDVSKFDTRNVTNMSNMFSTCRALTSLDVSGFITNKVTNMNYMFGECFELTALNVSGFETENVTDMMGMFSACDKVTALDVSGWNTQNVTDMSLMFNCDSLTSIDVSGFDTGKVTNMSMMFWNCEALTSLDVSNFNTENVIDMSDMFGSCNGLTSLDLSGFNTENVTDMSDMFDACTSLTTLDLSNFNTEKVTDMTHMFSMCSSLTTIYINEDIWKTAPTATDMFGGCGTSTLTPKEISST